MTTNVIVVISKSKLKSRF